jgi:hypothetical protein
MVHPHEMSSPDNTLRLIIIYFNTAAIQVGGGAFHIQSC